MEQIQIIRNEGNKKPSRIDEGREKGNQRNITTQRPQTQPAPQPAPKPAKKD
jgi:hypothetical protein